MIKNNLSLIIACLYLCLPVALTAEAIANGYAVKVVYVKDNEIFARSQPDGQAAQLTRDGLRKSLPVWSKDGTKIAFLEGSEDRKSLGRLIVMNETGKVLGRYPLRGEGDFAGGMRFVEGIEWIGGDRISVSGSVNPSLTETAVIDLATGAAEWGIFDDGPGADFSPDGKHFAYESGSPHFVPQENRRPTLNVDHVEVFPKEGALVEFVGERRWSPDSRRIATIINDLESKRQSLVVWSLEGKANTLELPVAVDATSDLFWKNDDLLITSSRGDLRVRMSAGKMEALALETARDDPRKQALSDRRSLLDVVAQLGGQDADFWCRSCPLESLPRKASTKQEND